MKTVIKMPVLKGIQVLSLFFKTEPLAAVSDLNGRVFHSVGAANENNLAV